MTVDPTALIAQPEGLMGNICQFCGAYSRRSCEMEGEFGICPLDDADPDWLREDRDERRQLEREWGEAP